jgi:hypothetical protein
MIKLGDILNEDVKDGVVTCDDCNWHWDISDGGDSPYLCHKCGNDNTPISEDLRKWFGKGKTGGWDRYNTKGEKVGKCGDSKEGSAYVACLSNEKAAKLGKDGRASFVKRKRVAQKDAGDSKKGGEQKKGQKPTFVKTGASEGIKEDWSQKYKNSINCSDPKGFSQKAHCDGKKKNEIMSIEEKINLFLEKNCPTDPEKWSASKSAAKSKFDVYPSAYANGWASKNYKSKGGKWKVCSEGEANALCEKTYPIKSINELEIPSGKWVNMKMSDVDLSGMKLIWSMYKTAYKGQGLDLSAGSATEMQSKYKAIMLVDVDGDKEPDAFIIYKTTPFGNKMALLAANIKKQDAKRAVVKKAIELVKTAGWFLEASAKMEDIMKASGAPVVRDEQKILDILGNAKKPEFVGDGYYTRALSMADKRITKRLYVRPK